MSKEIVTVKAVAGIFDSIVFEPDNFPCFGEHKYRYMYITKHCHTEPKIICKARHQLTDPLIPIVQKY